MIISLSSSARRPMACRKDVPKKSVSAFGSLVIAAGVLSFALVDNANIGLPVGSMGTEAARHIPVQLRAAYSISIKNLQFDPNTLDIAVGDTVTWTNNEADGTVHNVTSDSNSFVSPDLAPGSTFSYTATSPGTFGYHCRFHPQTTGTLNVSGDGAPPPPGQQPPPPPPPAPPPPPPDDPGGGGGGLLPGLLPGITIPELPITEQAPALAGAPAPSGPLASFNELMSQLVQQLRAAPDR